MLAESVGKTGNGGGGAAEDYILIRDEKSSGVHGGTFTLGSWQTRTLNTEVSDSGNHASISSNQITLAAGTYRVKSHAPAFAIDDHKIRLYNITDASDEIVGTSETSFSSGNNYNRSFLEGKIVLASSKVLELQHRSSATKTTNGFGRAATFGVIEVFAVIEFWKEA